jgi:hypothetical protein
LSDNSIQKKDRKFFFRRKGEMQGTSAPTYLVSARLTNSVTAHIPDPPAYTDFYFESLVGIASSFLVIETESSGGEVIVELTSPIVGDIITAIETAIDVSILFSNRVLTIYADPTDSWLRIKQYTADPSLDAAVLLGFPSGDFFSAHSKPGWDAPALGKNKETFIQRYENNLSDAVNRGLSALASNEEEHNRFLSEELVVPKFVNTQENPGTLEVWEDGGSIRGLILNDRAYISDIKNHSPASLEKLFVLTDKFGACSITVGDRLEPVRICDVTTGEPSAGTVKRRVSYFSALGATTEYAVLGDGNSVIGLDKQTNEGLISDFTVSEIIDGVRIRVEGPANYVYEGCRVTWPGTGINAGNYTVVSVDEDIIELLATSSGRDCLVNEYPPAGVVSIYHSNAIDSGTEPLYLLFDKELPADTASIVHGFGLLYGARTSVKDFLMTTLMGNLKGQAVSDIVVRSLQAIRGPNSRNYRSTRIGDPDGYDGDVDTSTDAGDLISLESLSSRELLGRDVFDLSGAGALGTLSSTSKAYTTTDGSRATAFAGTPLTLFGDTPAVNSEFAAIVEAASVNTSKWSTRVGGAGPFKGILVDGGILTADAVFVPTDVGLSVRIAPEGGTILDADDVHKALVRVWTVSKYISPDQVLLSCVDLPSNVSVADFDVDFEFGTRRAQNLSAGSLLRLDKISDDPDSDFAGSKVNALVLADTAGITGVVTLTPVAHDAANFANKVFWSTAVDNPVVLDIFFAENSSLIYQLHPQDITTPLVPSQVITALLDDLPAGSWTVTPAGAYSLVTFNHTPVIGATVVEITSQDGSFDGLFLVKKVSLHPQSYYVLHLCDFALNDVSVPSGTLGTCRLYNIQSAQGTRAISRQWFNPAGVSKSFHSFFGAGNLPSTTDVGVTGSTKAVVARFAGAGTLSSVVEISATSDQPLLRSIGSDATVPDSALRIWASSPSVGIQVNTATSETSQLQNILGGTGVRVASATTVRQFLTEQEGTVVPASAAIVATQFNVTDDPVLRDPVAIFATQPAPIAAEPDLSLPVVVSDYDTNAQVISYVCDDVYQTSDQRVHWSVYIFENGIIDESYVLVSSTDIGYVDYEVTIAAGASNSVTLNSADKKLEIVIAGTPYTASELVTAINALTQFTAVCSNTGGWNISIASLIGTGSLSERAAALHPTSISQSKINTAIEAIKGDIVVTDGIFAIQEQEGALTGVGSHLIPVNPEVPLQPSLADDLDVSTGYDLGEPEIVWSAPDKRVVLGETKIALFAMGSEESHVNRRLDITFDGDTITRYITGLEGGYYTLNQPVVFPGWSGVSYEVVVSVTLYGRRWRNIYAQNIEVASLSVTNLEVDTLSATTIEATTVDAETVIANVIPKAGIRKTIPARDFSVIYDPHSATSFRYEEPVFTVPTSDGVVGWYLDLLNFETFDSDEIATLLYCWSPPVSEIELNTVPIQYRIVDVVAHYRSNFDLNALTIPGVHTEFAMVAIRTHQYRTDALNDFTTPGDPDTGYFAGGYDTAISAGFAGSQRITSIAFELHDTPTLSMTAVTQEPWTTDTGYFSFKITLRPQITFAGLTIIYEKVFP